MKIVAKPVRMIAVFWPGEKPIPYKFKLREKDGEYTTIKIDKILYSYKSKIAGIEAIIYACQSLMGDVEKRYELKYILATCRWELYKI